MLRPEDIYMKPTVFGAFLITGAIMAALLVLFILACIVNDYLNYRDLQKRLHRDRRRRSNGD